MIVNDHFQGFNNHIIKVELSWSLSLYRLYRWISGFCVCVCLSYHHYHSWCDLWWLWFLNVFVWLNPGHAHLFNWKVSTVFEVLSASSRSWRKSSALLKRLPIVCQVCICSPTLEGGCQNTQFHDIYSNYIIIEYIIMRL